MAKRDEQSAYPGSGLFELGNAKIGKELTKIRESLIAEKNLVE